MINIFDVNSLTLPMGFFLDNPFSELPCKYHHKKLSFSDFMNESNMVSSFIKKDNNYVASIILGKHVTEDMFELEVDDEKHTIRLNFNHDEDGVKWSVSEMETLPLDADLDSITANLTDGVLHISMKQKQKEA